MSRVNYADDEPAAPVRCRCPDRESGSICFKCEYMAAEMEVEQNRVMVAEIAVVRADDERLRSDVERLTRERDEAKAGWARSLLLVDAIRARVLALADEWDGEPGWWLRHGRDRARALREAVGDK